MQINEVDYGSKKGLEEVSDKMQIERCVMEMVAWVAEHDAINKTNDVERKVNYNEFQTKNLQTATSELIESINTRNQKKQEEKKQRAEASTTEERA